MDTNVKRREWVKTAAIIFLAVLLVLTFFSNTIMNASLPEVATQQVTQGTINAKIRASGTITANETYNVKLAQSRKIESVKCKVGQAVNAGDVLFVLEAQESDELKAAKTDLEAKELDYQKSLITASNDSAQEDRDVQKLRDAYNEALTIYSQYSSMDASQIATAKAKADAAKRKADQAALDDFMNGGDVGGGSASKGGNANKGGTQGSGAGLGAGDGGKVGDQYAGVIKREIQRRFLKDPSFAGKVCSIKIQLGRDGTILGYQRVSGPDDICTAALSAVARTKKVPAAPSDAIYEKYKAPTIDFDINAR